MTVEELLTRTRSELSALGSEQGRRSAQRFFKEPVDCYGVSSPQLKALERRLAPGIRALSAAERNRFCMELLKAGEGIGWLLKENYVAAPEPTVRFLRERSARTARLVLRYAAEKMDERDRRIVLGRA
jgi:3-methyladenine DNA glycosylase AlkD